MIDNPIIPAGRSTVDRLAAIHRKTIDRFTYISDPQKWQTPDYWVGAQDILAMAHAGRWEGDCDDYALIVRQQCREAGIPTRLVFCWVPSAGGYHLGLEHNGWFADCNHPHLTPRDLIGYEYISISGYETGEPWHYVRGFDHTKPWPHLRA